MAIIEVEHVTKEYRLGAMQSLKTIANRMIGRSPPDNSNFKALDDISFNIEKGEVVGIIGHNGAGKSTLLKLLSRITTPTSGRITVRGKIAPLIEVGAGLVGDMTGRENIYLNASILGMSKAVIKSKIDEIIEFSELERFIDTPIKRYSSGMQVRLGFSIATSANADILIVDEVLAVGDVSFQRKCMDRMEAFRKSDDRTLLIVGHNVRQLERICTRMIMINHGCIVIDDAPAKVSKLYFDMTTNGSERTEINSKSKSILSTPTTELDIINIDIVSEKMTSNDLHKMKIIKLHHPLIIKFEVNVRLPLPNCEINVGIHNSEMSFVVKTSPSMCDLTINLESGRHLFEVTFDSISFAPGPYGVGIGIYDSLRRTVWGGTDLVWFEIEAEDDEFKKMPAGALSYMPTNWKQTRLNLE
jgi:ABC-type polysaccharide/polyol phosphate transport system ATPase subunit